MNFVLWSLSQRNVEYFSLDNMPALSPLCSPHFEIEKRFCWHLGRYIMSENDILCYLVLSLNNKKSTVPAPIASDEPVAPFH